MHKAGSTVLILMMKQNISNRKKHEITRLKWLPLHAQHDDTGVKVTKIVVGNTRMRSSYNREKEHSRTRLDF
jgi:hypothetical protein